MLNFSLYFHKYNLLSPSPIPISLLLSSTSIVISLDKSLTSNLHSVKIHNNGRSILNLVISSLPLITLSLLSKPLIAIKDFCPSLVLIL